MKHDDLEPLEKDPLWDLLRESPRAEVRSSFADDVVRAARLSKDRAPWWQRFRLPLAGGLTAATAALAVALLLPADPAADGPAAPIAGTAVVETTESFDDLDEALRTETLLVAAENPSEFSDAELVALLTF